MSSGPLVHTADFNRFLLALPPRDYALLAPHFALGSHSAVGMAVVQLPGTAGRIGAEKLRAASQESTLIRDLAARCNHLLLAQMAQSVACNALHGLEQRLCRWLLHAYDCLDGEMVSLTQEFLGQMLGVRRTSVTIAARRMQTRG